MNFDYKKILAAYIAHIGLCEGTDYLGRSADDGIDGLTAEEVAELRAISSDGDAKLTVALAAQTNN